MNIIYIKKNTCWDLKQSKSWELVLCDILFQENTYQMTINNQRDVNRKRVLLNAHSERCGDDVARVQEFTTRVSDWSERINGLNRLVYTQMVEWAKRVSLFVVDPWPLCWWVHFRKGMHEVLLHLMGCFQGGNGCSRHGVIETGDNF